MINRALKDKRILVVEDDDINQLLLKRTLEKLSATIILVEDGKAAMDELAKSSFEMILIDLHLPDMDGYELAKVIRQDLKLKVPLFAVSALEQHKERERCLNAGMNGFISKPFTVKKLEDEILKNSALFSFEESEKKAETKEDLHVDLDFLFSVALGDKEYIKVMIETFNENFPLVIDDMRKYLEIQDWKQLQKKAHYAKSSLSVIKVVEMLDLVIEMEGQCKATPLREDMEEKIELLAGYFEQARAKLLTHID